MSCIDHVGLRVKHSASVQGIRDSRVRVRVFGFGVGLGFWEFGSFRFRINIRPPWHACDLLPSLQSDFQPHSCRACVRACLLHFCLSHAGTVVRAERIRHALQPPFTGFPAAPSAFPIIHDTTTRRSCCELLCPRYKPATERLFSVMDAAVRWSFCQLQGRNTELRVVRRCSSREQSVRVAGKCRVHKIPHRGISVSPPAGGD